MRKNRIGIVVYLSLIGFGLPGQTVEHFIELAKKDNAAIESIILEYKASLEGVEQLGVYPDPKINVGLGVLPVETRLGPQRLKLGASQQLPWPGLLAKEKQVAEAKAEIKSMNAKVRFLEIEFMIREAYIKLTALEEQLDVISKRIDILEGLQELAKSALKSGKGKLSNVLLLERKINELTYNIELLQKSKEQAVIVINRWTNRPLLMEIELLGSSDISSEDLDLMLDRHPAVLKLNKKILASQEVLEFTNYQQKPKITVGLEYSLITKRQNIDLENNGRDVLMPMAMISLPINKKKYIAKKNQEKMTQEAIQVKIENQKNSFLADIRQAESTIELVNLELAKFIELKKITKETIDLMRIEYQSEGTKFEELLRLEMELLDYELSIVQAGYNLAVSEAILNKYNN